MQSQTSTIEKRVFNGSPKENRYQNERISQRSCSVSSLDQQNTLQRALGNKSTQRLLHSRYIQSKHKLGQKNGKYEQEVDRIASQIFALPSSVKSQNSVVTQQTPPNVVQRSCSGCSKEYEDAEQKHRLANVKNLCPKCRIQAKPLNGQNSIAVSEHELTHTVNQSSLDRIRQNENRLSTTPRTSGDVLPEPLRQRAQYSIHPSFDFGKVRIHYDDTRANKHNALAYTIGNDVVVGNGVKSLYSKQNLKLIGHELAHVVQQSRGGSLSTSPYPGNTIEKAADKAGHAFSAGKSSQVEGSARIGIARTPRSLGVSLLPSGLSDGELETEIQEIRNWLISNTGSSEESWRLEQALTALEAEVNRRTSSRSTSSTPETTTPTVLASDLAQPEGVSTSPATPVAAPAPVMQTLAPPGNCIQGQHDAMQRLVKMWCDHPSGRACTGTESCLRIQQKIRRNQLCAQHRRTINDLCYNGGDIGHQIAERDARRGQATCMAEYRARCEPRPPPVPVRVPDPVEVPRRVPEVDRGFMERMAEITGLTGTALIVYIVLSEGSRLFPPRNLVPVP